jgi:predicted deacetylase
VTERQVVVSVHDIAPSTADGVHWLLDRLDAIGVRRRVLKVVPRWKGVDDLRGDDPVSRRLVDRLHEDAARGSEVMFHGLTHALEGPPLGPWHQRLRIRLFSPRSPEFAGLDADAARRRLAAGLGDLAALGFDSPGFCPPSWIAPRWLDAVAHAAGFRYIVRVNEVLDLDSGVGHRWPTAGYMGVGGRHERFYELQRELTARSPFQPHVLRFHLHPQGAQQSPAAGRALHRLRRVASERDPVTYADLLAAS